MRYLTIRARITLGSAAVALVLIAIAGVAIRLSAEQTLRTSDISVATTDLASFAKDLETNRGEHVDTPGTGVLVLVKSPDGHTAVSTVPDEVAERIANMTPADRVFDSAEDGSPYVVVSQKVSTPGGVWGLWAARSTESSRLALEGVDKQVIAGGLAALAAFTIAAWLLATLALRPVTAMRRRAETLRGSAATERLPVGAARDELSALATTLNDFLDRVNESTLREKRMVSDAAHELRTPLAALRTQLELAHDDFDDPGALRDEIIGAEDSVARLTNLANGLLELSRLEGHEAPPNRVPASVLLDETMGSIDRARMIALRKGVEVTFSADDLASDSRYDIAPDAFARLLDNLLANAIAAVPGEGTVDLLLAETADSLELEITDNGPGVPESFLPIAFDRFTRPDESRSSMTGGSGLGLALVRAIAESAGGTAQLGNTGSGAMATVHLPKM